MRLRSVRLGNIRRFTDPVRVDGFRPGVNVLSAPNESGKSTLFDALSALFFVPHRSKGKEIAGLRPHAGGAPEVTAEIEIDGVAYTIFKRWFSRPEARVDDATRLIAQADAAEAWIAERFGTDPLSGPAGFLWVGQGQFALEPGAPKDRERALSTRRDLLQSVAGEVERITGGRRMDAALARAESDLGAFATATGKPRAGGPWRDALDRADALRARHAELDGLATELGDAVQARRRLRRELEEIADPEHAEGRRARLDAARAAFEAAERQAEAVSRHSDALAYAKLSLKTAEDDLARLASARTALAGMEDRLAEAGARAEEAVAGAERADGACRASDAALAEAGEEARQAGLMLRAASRRDRAAREAERRAALVDRIAAAEAAAQAAQALARSAEAGPDAPQMERIEALAQARDTALAVSRAAAPRIVLHYEAGVSDGVRLGGAPLSDGAELPIHEAVTLELSGIGTIEFTPGQGAGGDAVAQGTEALDSALAEAGADDLATAREAARTRREAAHARRTHLDRLQLLAPEGLDALRAALADLPEMPAGEEGPPLAEAERAADAAQARREAAEAAHARARSTAEGLRTEAARAEAVREGVRERHAAALADLPDIDADAAEAVRAEAAARVKEAQGRLNALAGQAPDLPAARAAYERAASVSSEAERRLHRLREEIARLDERIALRSGQAVTEELADCTAQLDEAEARLARIEHEVALLTRLQSALDEARTASRERYFAPVLDELRPLLRLLWPDAQVAFDDDTLLPSMLSRPRTGEEAIDILSGGTREQVAMLVRLAFARMLAHAGRPVPVILDDALAFTDDDRIEAMFTALHRQASDLQIVVLTCRQRAFRALGGTGLEFAPDEALSSPARS